MSRSVVVRAVAIAWLALAGAAAPAVAQSGLEGLGLRLGFGRETMTGDMADALDDAIDADFTILYPFGSFRAGLGVNWASFDVVDQDSTWNQIRLHLLGSWVFEVSPSVRPYLEARYIYRRLYPEDDRYIEFDEEAEEGEEAVLRDFRVAGSGLEAVGGVEIFVTRRVAIDLSGAWGVFSVSPDLSEEGFGPIDSGGSWRIFAGIAWFPLSW